MAQFLTKFTPSDKAFPYRLNDKAKHKAGIHVDNHGNPINLAEYEHPEQVEAFTRITGDLTVLELGARFGVISNLINSLLDNPENHLVVEPDVNILPTLKRNRLNNRAKYQIFEGILHSSSIVKSSDVAASSNDDGRQHLGSVRLVPYGTASFVSTDDKHPGAVIESISNFHEIQEASGLVFDCLVADCEGALEEFIFEQVKEDITQFKIIMYEKDWPDRCNYDRIKAFLLQSNFVCLKDTGLHTYFVNMNFLPFTISEQKVGHEALGLFGKRGLSHEFTVNSQNFQTSDVSLPSWAEELILAIGTKSVHPICAHAPATITISVKEPMILNAFINSDVPLPLTPKKNFYTFMVDDVEVETIKPTDYLIEVKKHNGFVEKKSILKEIQKFSDSILLQPGRDYVLKIVAGAGQEYGHTGWILVSKDQLDKHEAPQL